MDRAAFIESWIKRQAKGEKDFSETLAEFFEAQTRAIVAELRKQDVGASADALFSPREWDKELKAVGKKAIERLVVTGAVDELEQAKAVSNGWEKAPRVDIEKLRLRLPPATQDAIDQFLDETMGKPWWDEMNAAVRDNLAAALQAGLDAGENLTQLADRVQTALDDAGQVSATRTARTESTGALQAGAEFQRQELAREGLVTGKEWLVVSDEATRESHLAAHGQRVNAGAKFDIGGEPASYPGDTSLSPENRLHCRCTVASITVASDDAERGFSSFAGAT
jgi:uncharacterized protein with gpF-like domain